MSWSALYPKDREPTLAQMDAFVASPLWQETRTYLQNTYKATPKLVHSGCTWQPGWNAKYQKGGRSLCTLYPMEGFFLALVVIGEKEKDEVELKLPMLSPYTQSLYTNTAGSMGAKWLMMAITSEEILRDLKVVVAARRKPDKR